AEGRAGLRRDLAPGLRPGEIRGRLEPAALRAPTARLRAGDADEHRHAPAGEGAPPRFPRTLLLPLPLPERDWAPPRALPGGGEESEALPDRRGLAPRRRRRGRRLRGLLRAGARPDPPGPAGRPHPLRPRALQDLLSRAAARGPHPHPALSD